MALGIFESDRAAGRACCRGEPPGACPGRDSGDTGRTLVEAVEDTVVVAAAWPVAAYKGTVGPDLG